MKRLSVILLVIFFSALSFAADLAADDSRTVKQTFSASPGSRLKLDLEAGGSVIIEGWDKSEIHIVAEIGGGDADLVEIEFDETKGGLDVHSYIGHRFHHVDVDIDVTVRVPRRFDVEIDTKGGDVEINGVEGDFNGETMGGDLELIGMKGEVDLKTMGGDVKVEDSDLDGEVSTMGGDVTVRNVTGGLQAHTMGGTVTYDDDGKPSGGKGAPAKQKAVRIETKGGDIEMNTPAERIEAKTFGGDVKVAKAEVVHVTTMGGDVEVGEAPAGAELSTMGGDITVQSAGGHVDAETMGGDITLEAVDGSVKANTLGGDVEVRIVGDPKKGDKGVNIESLGGDIELTVPEGLGMEFDITIEVTKGRRREGRIESDFPEMKVDNSEKWHRHGLFGQSRRRIYGTGAVGDGSNLIKIKTMNGNVFIRKAGS